MENRNWRKKLRKKKEGEGVERRLRTQKKNSKDSGKHLGGTDKKGKKS